MSDISIDEVKRLAGLSALSFTQAELENFVPEFSQILAFVDQVKNSDIGDTQVQYLSHDLSELREDVIQESLSQETVLLNSPKTKKGAFCVPKMLED